MYELLFIHRKGFSCKAVCSKYKLRSRAKVYKIGSRNLNRLLKERKGQSPKYHNLLRMGLVESIDGLQYTRMSLVPETDYSPFPNNWIPDHERALFEYIRLEQPKTLEEQRNCLKEQGLISPQDFISMLVWNYKRNAMVGNEQTPIFQSGDDNTSKISGLLMSSTHENLLQGTSDKEDIEVGFDVAQM